MSTNIFYSLKDFPKKRLYALAYYFFKTSLEVDSYRNFKECQHFYNHLVRALKLEEHSKKVVAAVIKQLINAKRLTLKKKSSTASHPYDFNGQLDEIYKEDKTIYHKCGSWETDTIDDINLV